MKVFVRNYALNGRKLAVSGGLGCGQGALRIEDDKALVLHRAGLERVNAHCFVLIEVVLVAVHLLVPAHGVLEAFDVPVNFVFVRMLGEDTDVDVRAGCTGEAVASLGKVAGNEGKEVARLGNGILVRGLVTAVTAVLAANEIAVGEEDRAGLLVGADSDSPGREDIGTIEVEGGVAEALGLHLGGEVAIANVEAFEGKVGLGIDLDESLQLKGAIGWQSVKGEAVEGGALVLGVRLAIDGELEELNVRGSVELEAGGRVGGVTHTHTLSSADARIVGGTKVTVQGDGVDQVGGRRILRQLHLFLRLLQRCVCSGAARGGCHRDRCARFLAPAPAAPRQRLCSAPHKHARFAFCSCSITSCTLVVRG